MHQFGPSAVAPFVPSIASCHEADVLFVPSVASCHEAVVLFVSSVALCHEAVVLFVPSAASCHEAVVQSTRPHSVPAPPEANPLSPAGTSLSPPRGRRFAGSTITAPAPAPAAHSPTSVGSQAVVATIPARPVPRPPQGPLADLRVHTTLRHSEFERELRNHPDKAWVSWLLHSILNGVSVGYKGPHTPYTAHNLSSALQHPDVITSELQKEVAAGRVLGPFADRPLPSLRTSGLGAAAKKQGKWRMILHLSAPYGASVNDGISKEEFSLHYSSMDDAVKLLHSYGKGAIMAKVDLKADFRMVPVRAAD